MGRKIPARKHHGIRDPLKQAQERWEKIKDKVDNPPTKQDDQKVSGSLAKFIKLKESTKKGNLKKILKQHGIEDKPKKGKGRPFKKLPNFKQQRNETDEQFMHRVNKATRETAIEANYEAKYGIDIVKDSKTGKVTVQKRKDEFLLTKRKQKAALTKEQKEMIKKELEKQKLKKLEEKKSVIEEFKKDEFKFGEVVHAPPSLSVLPRSAKKNELGPGNKNLLLKTLIGNNSSEDTNKPVDRNVNIFKTQNKIDLKGKRKDLPFGVRERLEKERESTVELYRMLKKKKYENKN